ncbi:MAG: hypothetical protein H7289_03655, partial [Mucilaginibacter sp.]|nr:hypothetical protein [Mucilaginibacter sp.]
MKNDKIIPGVVLIMIGAVILLNNYGYIHFHWHNFFYLWPVFIVIAGINLIFAHNRAGWATALKIGVLALGFGLIIFGNFGKHNGRFDTAVYFGDDDDNDKDSDSKITKIEGNSQFKAPYIATVKIAHLNISGGGTTYRLSDTTSQLFTATTHEFKGRYTFNQKQTDSVSVLNFNMKGNHGFNLDFGDDDDKK